VVINRSVPPDAVLPHITYRDVAEASAWLTATLGFTEHTVFVADVDAHYNRAKAAGATIVEDVHETIYGERQYAIRDLDGHHWLFSTHARDLSPTDWGATITTPPRQSDRG